MSEISECTSAGCLSADNIVRRNDENVEVPQLQMIPPTEETRNELLHTTVKDTMQAQDENTAIKDSTKVEASPLLPSVKQENNSSPVVTENGEALISKLQNDIKETINERDLYKNKLEVTQKKLADLEGEIYNTIGITDNNLTNVREIMIELKNKFVEATTQLKDRGVVMANQEKQINALNHQVTTLKEVVAITRDLLEIRNTEVKHLQAEVDDMEARIAEERDKHNTMLSKMDAAVRLNSDLKKEYETQLSIFKDLRIKYDEKITLLSEEKRALESAHQLATNETKNEVKD